MITDRQYRQVLKNIRRRPDTLLADCGVNSLLRIAARELRDRERVEAAWPISVPSDLAGAGEVEAVVDGAVTIRACDGIAQQKLQRRSSALLAALRRRVPGLRKLVILPPNGGDVSTDE